MLQDDDSVNAGVAKAIDLLNGLDVVINNAGVGVLGIQEQFSIDDLKRLFDINVFGVQRVNRAALPFLRNQGSGPAHSPFQPAGENCLSILRTLQCNEMGSRGISRKLPGRIIWFWC